MTHTTMILGVAALCAAAVTAAGCERGSRLVVRAPDAVPSSSVARAGSSSALPSMSAAARRVASLAAVDARVDDWIAHTPEVGNHVDCAMTCHTAMPAALAHGALGSDSAALGRLRGAIALRVASVDDWATATPFYGDEGSAKARQSRATEAVLDAVSLAAMDRASGVVSDDTRRAIAHLWTMQRPDGGFDWLDFGLEPFEAGESGIGAALAARAVALRGIDREDRSTASHVAGLRAYLSAALRDPATIGFDRAFLMWGIASLRGTEERARSVADDDAARPTPDELVRWYTEIARAQAPDGGFSWSAVGVIGARGRLEEGDPLPTAVAVLGLCDAVDPRAIDAREKGVAWLLRAQRADGGFASLSPNRDTPFNHLLASDAATGFAAVALVECAR